MTNIRLGHSYVERARGRLEVLPELQARGLHADVVREAQEVVELALKGLLRIAGIDPPKEHDVGKQMTQHRDRLPPSITAHLREIGRISKQLRREREIAFCGDDDFIPSDEYDADDSDDAIARARQVVEWVEAGVAELETASD